MCIESQNMFIPATFDLSHSEKYILSIRIWQKGFMFSISDPSNKKNFCLRETTFSIETSLLDNIQRIIFELGFLTQQYKETNVIFVSPEYDILPSAYFSGGEKAELYDFVHHEKSDNILTNVLEKQSAIIQYNVESSIYEFLSRNLCNPHFFHHSHLLAQFFEDKGKSVSMKSKMFVYFHDNMFDIICFSRSEFKHCLSFRNDSPNTQLYYILKTWEQCTFDQLNDLLFLAGSIDEYILVELQKYIKNVETLSAPREVFLWNEEALHAPFDLLSLSLS